MNGSFRTGRAVPSAGCFASFFRDGTVGGDVVVTARCGRGAGLAGRAAEPVVVLPLPSPHSTALFRWVVLSFGACSPISRGRSAVQCGADELGVVVGDVAVGKQQGVFQADPAMQVQLFGQAQYGPGSGGSAVQQYGGSGGTDSPQQCLGGGGRAGCCGVDDLGEDAQHPIAVGPFGEAFGGLGAGADTGFDADPPSQQCVGDSFGFGFVPVDGGMIW